MQLVMTGFDCCAYRVWNAVPNVDWSVYMDNQQAGGDPHDRDDRHDAPPPRRVVPDVARPEQPHAGPEADDTGGPAC
jgi:hypothetical protein